MKLLTYPFGITLFIFSNLIFSNTADVVPSVTTPATTNDLKYKIMKDATNHKMKVHLVLGGGKDYATGKHCHMKKSNDADATYEEINPCPGTATGTHSNKCVRPCLGDDNKMEFDKFSPRTKYIVVFTGDSAETAFTKENEGTVFGLELPLLVNPQVTITIDTTSRLKLSTITCKQVACPIYYKDVKYVVGTAGGSCIAPNSANEVEFDLMIPHYEMRCETYPSFFYKLQNPHTLFNIDVYKPQYYVTYKSTEKTKYSLKFTNKFSYEMCRFGIKDVATTITTASTNEYTSNCGGTNKDCYAPCNNVVLTLSTSKPVVDVLIQTRYTPLQKVNSDYVGYKQSKYVVVIDTTADTDGLLHTETATGVTLNIKLFKPDADPKFGSCTVTYYAADKPKPTTPTRAICNESSGQCGTECTEVLTIQQLASGKPYILEIAAPAAAENSLTANFVEHIFFRTEKSSSSTFPPITSTVTATNVLINHLAAGATAITHTNTEETCAYYISPRGKDVYVCAFCLGSYPCRGYCKEPQTILGLTPGTDYDLKVVAHKEHGSKKFEITTPPATIALAKENIDKGFKVIGTLTPENAATLCNYKVKVEQGSTYVTIHECPATPPPAPVVAAAASSSIVSKLSQMFVARASSTPDQSTPGATTSTGSTTQTTTTNGAPSTQTGTNNAATTPTTNTATATAPTTCTEAPYCANIQFTSGYDRSKKYQVSVTTKFGLSTEVTIDIPANPLPVSEAVEKKVTVNIERDGNKLKVTTTLPTGVTEKTCGWELRNSTSTEKPLIKSCNGANDNGCASFPSCAEFEILNVEDVVDYHLTVYVSDDSTIIGTGEIKKGETYDTSKSISKNTIIMAAAGAGIVVILVAVVIVVMKKRN